MKNNLDSSLADIMEAWREENNARNEADRERILKDKDERTIKAVIKDIEDKYFDGKHLYRNGGAKSDFLFRYEIKELLVALLKLEVSDTFKDARAKKTGVSNVKIDTLMKVYRNIAEMDNLRPHEWRVLNLSFDSAAARDHIETLRRLSESVCRFFLMTAMFYTNNASFPFNDVINEFDAKTTRTCMRQYEIAKYKDTSLPIYNCDFSKMVAERHEDFEFMADIRLAIVKAIERISSIIYEFDDNKACKRRKMADVVCEIEEIRNIAFSKEVKEEAASVDSITAEVTDIADDDITIIDEFLEHLFEVLYQDPMHSPEDFLQQQLPAFCESLPKYFFKYLKFMNDPKPSVDTKNYVLKTRTYLSTQLVGSYPFNETLYRIENDLLGLSKGKKYTSLYEFERDKGAQKVIDKHMTDFFHGVLDNAKLRSSSLKSMKEALKSCRIGSTIVDNYEKLYHQCEDIVSNVFAMVLRIEAERLNLQEDPINDVSKLFESLGFTRKLVTHPPYEPQHNAYVYEEDDISGASKELIQTIKESNSAISLEKLDNLFGCEGLLKAMGLRVVIEPIEGDDTENGDISTP